MSKKIHGNEYGLAARAVHTGNDVDGETGAIKRPITLSNASPYNQRPIELGADFSVEIYQRSRRRYGRINYGKT